MTCVKKLPMFKYITLILVVLIINFCLHSHFYPGPLSQINTRECPKFSVSDFKTGFRAGEFERWLIGMTTRGRKIKLEN